MGSFCVLSGNEVRANDFGSERKQRHIVLTSTCLGGRKCEHFNLMQETHCGKTSPCKFDQLTLRQDSLTNPHSTFYFRIHP